MKARIPIVTVAIRETIDQMTPVVESWLFSKIAGIQADALIISATRNIRNNTHPGLRANFFDKNSPKPKNIDEIMIQTQKGIIVKICIIIIFSLATLSPALLKDFLYFLYLKQLAPKPFPYAFPVNLLPKSHPLFLQNPLGKFRLPMNL